MPTEPQPITLSRVARRAAEIVDPDGDDAVVGEFELAFEDADEPVTAVDVERRVANVLERLDPEIENGALALAGTIMVYLSFRRDELDADAAELIRLAARAEWAGSPPAVVRDWLDEHALDV